MVNYMRQFGRHFGHDWCLHWWTWVQQIALHHVVPDTISWRTKQKEKRSLSKETWILDLALYRLADKAVYFASKVLWVSDPSDGLSRMEFSSRLSSAFTCSVDCGGPAHRLFYGNRSTCSEGLTPASPHCKLWTSQSPAQVSQFQAREPSNIENIENS